MKSYILPEIKDFQPYSSARDEFTGGNMVFLDANENPFEDTVYGAINRYPDPDARELRSEIAKLRKVNTDHIIVGNGSDELLDLLLRTTTRANQDSVVLCSPTYGMYTVLARLNGLRVIDCPLTGKFLPDHEAILEATKNIRARIIFLCSPNNPTGNIIPVELLVQIVSQTNALVVVDEAYIDFADTPSAISLLNRFENLAVLQTFSKAWGLAGLRLGVLFGSTDLIEGIKRVKLPYNVNVLTQRITLERLRNIQRFDQEREVILKERTRMQSACRALPGIQEVFPSDANFFLIRVNNATDTYQALLKRGIVVRNRTKEPGLSGCLRISVGTPEENQLLINALKEVAG